MPNAKSRMPLLSVNSAARRSKCASVQARGCQSFSHNRGNRRLLTPTHCPRPGVALPSNITIDIFGRANRGEYYFKFKPTIERAAAPWQRRIAHIAGQTMCHKSKFKRSIQLRRSTRRYCAKIHLMRLAYFGADACVRERERNADAPLF